ncbi:penicillin-binding transpeptidase domain-containing protein [Massilia sp. TS11]|uniref:penicillin-binding transpeptidase domain-containing protein n=1 Tax=Massilia sp. TS11 TaxID=2908003 RepID=UPI001EDAA6F3|nr:penicillin-binding transpeptidase domain-containing protein [Massilia sp. TS11]MCG2584511.1 hypothetical protein [Massilia sp. TS11]
MKTTLTDWLRQRRRRRHLRQARPAHRLPAWTALLLLIAGGAWLLAGHAQRLGQAAQTVSPSAPAVQALAAVLPGARLHLDPDAPFEVQRVGAATLLSVAGMQSEAAQRFSLCQPLQIVPQASATLGRSGQVVVSADPALPPLRLARAGGALHLNGLTAALRLVGDGAGPEVRRHGWLLGPGTAALAIDVDDSGACGSVQLRAWRPAAGARALRVVAFGADGAHAEVQLARGDYALAGAAAPSEDARLFTALQARGLLRLEADGLIALAPRELAVWRALPPAQRSPGPERWDAVVLDETARGLLRRLYSEADGAFVLAQVARFNSERRWLGWRVARSSLALLAEALPAPALPDAAARLLLPAAGDWEAWRSAEGPIELRLAAPAAAGSTLALTLAGRLQSLQGARVLEASPACLGPACTAPDQIQTLRLALEPGSRSVQISAAPLDISGLAASGEQAYRHLRVSAGQLVWHSAAGGAPAVAGAPWQGRIVDRAQTPLWQGGQLSAAARAAGLGPLLGVDARQRHGLAGMLGRLAAAPREAALTLDLLWQARAQAIIDCIGLAEGRWDGQACQGGQAAMPGRSAAAVVLDADSGEILVAAQGGAAAPLADWQALEAFERSRPGASPLRQAGWQHDGGAEHSPGSSFKLVSALGLELAAQRQGEIEALLGGQPLATLDRLAAARGFGFRSAAPSYPASGSGARITNYREAAPMAKAVDGRFGLAEALSFSLNTWFAWTTELSDASLGGQGEGGQPGLQALSSTGLDSLRPWQAMAHRVGFGRAWRLDGGLLPADFAWSRWDALQATAGGFDPVRARHEIRQQAIGLRMQATPLDLALVAAAIGSGRAVTPRLLAALDGRAASAAPASALGVRLDRIRQGMQGVVQRGTAAAAFAGPALAALRPYVYGKTGTAPVPVRLDGRVREDLATVWFSGYLAPDPAAGRARRLAFAVAISRSASSGGAHAAPLAAALLLAAPGQNPEQKGKLASDGGTGAVRERRS